MSVCVSDGCLISVNSSDGMNCATSAQSSLLSGYNNRYSVYSAGTHYISKLSIIPLSVLPILQV